MNRMSISGSFALSASAMAMARKYVSACPSSADDYLSHTGRYHFGFRVHTRLTEDIHLGAVHRLNLCFTAHTQDDADRNAGETRWRFPPCWTSGRVWPVTGKQVHGNGHVYKSLENQAEIRCPMLSREPKFPGHRPANTDHTVKKDEVKQQDENFRPPARILQ